MLNNKDFLMLLNKAIYFTSDSNNELFLFKPPQFLDGYTLQNMPNIILAIKLTNIFNFYILQ